MCLMALSMNAQYVDLGLPSGTQWKSETEWMPNKELKRQLDASRPRESVKDKIAEKQDMINNTQAKGGITHGKEQSR